MNKQGLLVVVSGFSGAGKGTVMKELVKKYNYQLSISATTRVPRVGEVHGREYFFLTRDEFKDMINRNELIEWAEYVGNFYGTPSRYVQDQLKVGKDVILEIEIQGALKVKEKFPEALLLFVTPDTAEELKNRLIARGTENIDTINHRLSRAAEEAVHMDCYDYIVINETNKLEQCVELVNQIILGEHNKTTKNKAFIEQMKNDLRAFKEGDI